MWTEVRRRHSRTSGRFSAAIFDIAGRTFFLLLRKPSLRRLPLLLHHLQRSKVQMVDKIMVAVMIRTELTLINLAWLDSSHAPIGQTTHSGQCTPWATTPYRPGSSHLHGTIWALLVPLQSHPFRTQKKFVGKCQRNRAYSKYPWDM